MARPIDRRRLLAGLGALVVAAAAGCGLPDDDRPRVIAPDDAPRDLEPSTTTTPEGGRDRVDLYFVDRQSGVLRAVRRQVEAATSSGVLAALLQGPGDGAGDLTTSIPSDTVVNSTRLDGNTLIVDLGPQDGGIVGIGAVEQLQAFAQIVFTATALPEVEDVRFTLEGSPLAATTTDGAVSDRPVDRTDYRSLAPGSGRPS